jgi:palmitoyltransferase
MPSQAKKRLKANRPLRHNSWRNKEGERLADFGLDEDAEFYDEDNLPLAEIMRRRKGDA